ncbi:MAG: hypothetical protein IJH65_04005 [Methanobrevibacter sp.]|nr:hypothetical protein [Methanobrevibacter sp.]
MVIAREHRGGLKESMETARTFETKEDMIKYYTDMWSEWEGKKVKITVSDVITYDNRIGWNTRYILCDGSAVGMCDLDYKGN